MRNHFRFLEPSLRACYKEQHRKYHTLQHVEELLDHLDGARHLVAEPELFELAIWYHDVVYDPVAPHGDNERLSAQLFAEHWNEISVITEPEILQIQNTIIATIDHRHDNALQHLDIALFLDADMAILGAEEVRFDEYLQQIRAEYNQVSDDLWQKGRAAFLEDALSRPTLFVTDHFRNRFEDQARQNTERELAALRKY